MKSNNGTLSLLLLLCFFISLDSAFKPQLYSSGGSICQMFQETRSYYLDLIAYIISELASLLTPIWGCFIMYERNLHAGIKCVGVFCWVRYGISILKILYSEPRPFWMYSWVSAVDCSEGFGNPAGHALLTGILWPYYYAHTFYSDQYYAKKSLLLFGILMIGIDRVYSGVHFYSQILLGWIYAISVLMLLFSNSIALEQMVQNLNTSYIKMLILLGVSIVGISIGLILPLIRFPYWDDDWTDRYEDVTYN